MEPAGTNSGWRRWIGAAVLALAAACAIAGCGPLHGVVQSPAPPNVILILTDDQDLESLQYMPNVKSLLMDRGVTFENAFVTDALCCPSRATILRGQYAKNHQVVGNAQPRGGHGRFRELGRDDSTVATWLRDEDYRTVLIGKYMNGYSGRYIPPGWDEWHAVSGNYLSNNLNENGSIRLYDPERYHLEDVFAEKATSYVSNAAGGDAPLFMWLGTKAPHLPATPAPRHEDDLADVSLSSSPSFDEKDVSDKPAWIRDNPPLTARQASRLKEVHRDRLRSLLAVDDMVGDLVDALRKSGELSNTYIFFTSDNGFHAGEHRLTTGKWTAYEEDIRVPLVVRGPGVPEGKTLEHLVLNNDLAPTFAALGGAQSPAFVDGRSLEPLLTENPPSAREWRDAFLVEAAAELPWTEGPPFPDAHPIEMPFSGDPDPRNRRLGEPASWGWGRPGLQAVRTTRHLYVEYDTGERELYDLKEDPYQLNNIYKEADAGLLTSLQKRLAQLRPCAGAACRAAEQAR